MIFRPLPVLTVCSAVSLVILMWLGNWQYGRYAEKIAREAAGPVPWETAYISPEMPTPFSIRTVLDGKPVWKIVLPIETASDATRYAVIELVEGNDPPTFKPIEDYPLVGQTVEGIFTSPLGPGNFTLAPNMEARAWYAFDGEAFSELLGVPPAAEVPLFEPVELKYTDTRGIARLIRNPYADFYQGDPLPPQRHFGYAITWWGLAIALFVMYLVFHHSQGRLRFRKAS